MKLSEIHDQWAIDAEIDKSNLDEAARVIPRLHARWMRIYTGERGVYRKIQTEQSMLRRDKWEYLQNRMAPERLQELAWPLNGLKILRQDIDVYLAADPDMQKFKEQLDVQETKLKVIEDILKQINNRNFLLKTIVEYLRFSKGEI